MINTRGCISGNRDARAQSLIEIFGIRYNMLTFI